MLLCVHWIYLVLILIYPILRVFKPLMNCWQSIGIHQNCHRTHRPTKGCLRKQQILVYWKIFSLGGWNSDWNQIGTFIWQLYLCPVMRLSMFMHSKTMSLFWRKVIDAIFLIGLVVEIDCLDLFQHLNQGQPTIKFTFDVSNSEMPL